MAPNLTNTSAPPPGIAPGTTPGTAAGIGTADPDAAAPSEVTTQPIDLPEFPAAGLSDAAANGIELLGDVELHVTVELGRTQMLVEDVLRLAEGSVVELDKLAGDPVDVYVNNRLIARGEVLVLNDNFCIRISEIVADIQDQVAEAASQQAASSPQASQAV